MSNPAVEVAALRMKVQNLERDLKKHEHAIEYLAKAIEALSLPTPDIANAQASARRAKSAV